jgi:hypothetical protein
MSIPVIPANAGIPLSAFLPPLRGFAAWPEAKFILSVCKAVEGREIHFSFYAREAAKPRRKEGYSGIPAFAGMTRVVL